MYRGDGMATIDHARRAAEQTAPASRVHALALHREAQGHALLGDRDACLRTLDQARHAWEKLPTGTAGQPLGAPVLGTSSVADPTDFVHGWCLQDLGRPDEALTVLESHLTTVPESAVRTRARVRGRLARAYAQAGDRQSACTATSHLLDDALPVDSATVRHDLGALVRLLNRWSSDAAVQEVAAQLRQVLRRPRRETTHLP